jgi:hypothetical protein
MAASCSADIAAAVESKTDGNRTETTKNAFESVMANALVKILLHVSAIAGLRQDLA